MYLPRITNTLEELLNEYSLEKTFPSLLYKAKFINRNGSIIDKDNKVITISNKIAELILNDNILESISMVYMPDNMQYIIKTHTGSPTTKTIDSNREEELVAMSLFKKKEFCNSDLDQFIDYQSPIYRGNDYRNIHIGKIDLIAINHNTKEILLMELKKYSSKETLLRCVTEIYTYYKQVNHEKLLLEVKDILNNDNILEYKIKPSVLVFKNKHQHTQYISSYYNNVTDLMDKLNVSMYIIDSDVSFDNSNIDLYISKCKIIKIDKDKQNNEITGGYYGKSENSR